MDPPASDYYRKRDELDESRVAQSPRDYPPHGEDSAHWEEDEEPREKEDTSLPPPEEVNSKKRHRRDSRDPLEEDDQRRGRGSPRGSVADDEEMVSASLLVRHLKFSTAPHVVRKFFEQCGEVKDVYLPLEYETGRPRGFGFVEFLHARDAQEALRTLNDTELEGARISISVAQHGRKTPSIMRTRSSGYRRSGRGGGRREPYSAPDRYNDRYDRGDSPPMRERGHRYDDGGYRGRDYRDRDRDGDRERDGDRDRDYGRGERSYREGGRESSSREDGYKSYGRRRY